RTPRTPPPGTLLQPHLALRDGRRPQMPTAVTIDIAVGRRVRIRAVARPARRSAVEDEADVDDARDVGVRSLAVPSSKFALGVAAVIDSSHFGVRRPENPNTIMIIHHSPAFRKIRAAFSYARHGARPRSMR